MENKLCEFTGGKPSLLVAPQLLTVSGLVPVGEPQEQPLPLLPQEMPPHLFACTGGLCPALCPITGNHRGEGILPAAIFCGSKTDAKLITIELCCLGEPIRCLPGVPPPSSGKEKPREVLSPAWAVGFLIFRGGPNF